MVENWGLLDFSLLFLHAASCAVGTIGTVILYDNENINKPFDLKLTEAGFNVCSSTSQTGCTLCVQNLESVSDTLSHPLAKNWCIVSVIMTIHILEWNRYPLTTLHDYNAQATRQSKVLYFLWPFLSSAHISARRMQCVSVLEERQTSEGFRISLLPGWPLPGCSRTPLMVDFL